MKKALVIMLVITIAFVFTVVGLFFGRMTTDGSLRIHARESIRNETSGEDQQTVPGLININTADSEQLQELPGVGVSTAEAIIAYRKENGPFKNTKDIMDVKGIGEKTYEQLKNMITVEEGN